MSESGLLDLLRLFPWEPAWLLTLVVALIYGTFFRLFWGRRRRGLIFYWLIALLAMLVAQWIFSRAPLAEWSLGNLRIIESSVLCWAVLFLVHALKR